MPAKNSIGKFHGRFRFITKDLWIKYCKETNSSISFDDFKLIIDEGLSMTRKWVIKEPVGFKSNLGIIAINKFKTYGEFKTYLNVKNEGKAIRNFNLHSGGSVCRIQWFHVTRTHKDRVSYWNLDCERRFKRELAAMIKSGKAPVYNTYMQNQFYTKRN